MGSSYFSSHPGGLELVAGRLFDEFASRGQDIVWIAGNATPPPQALGRSRTVPFRIFNFFEDKTGVPFPIPSPGSIRKIVREVRSADVLVLHDSLYLSNILAFLAAQWRGTPVIVIQHIGFILYRNPFLKLVMKAANKVVTGPMLSHSAQVVFISETTKQCFRRLHLRNAAEVIFNGVDTETFRMLEGAETVREIRRASGLPEDGVVILFVGRFVEKKGIAAMKRMAAMRPDWTWVFAGSGPLDPGQWNLPNVRVFSGLRGPSLAPLFRCCDLLALPSTGEGFPLVIQEALASGLPVVCGEETLGADPAMEAFVAAAPLFPGADEKTAREFLSVIDRVLDCESRAGGMAEERRAFAIAHYSWRRATEHYLEIVSRLTN